MRFYGATLRLAPPESWSPHGYVPLRGGAVTIGVQHHSKLPVEHHFSRAHLTGPRGVGLEIVIEVDDVDRAYALATPRQNATMDESNRSVADRGAPGTSV